MEAETERLLAELHAERARYGEAEQPPASDAEVAAMIESARVELGAEPPAAYCDLLRRSNGLNDNGLFVYATHDVPNAGTRDGVIAGFVQANLHWREGGGFDRLLVFGDGNQDLYVLDLDTADCQVRDRVPADTVIRRLMSFDALLAAALLAHR